VDQALGEQHAGVVGQCGLDLLVGPNDWGRSANNVSEADVVLEEERTD
jgi:hypothetical protein